MDEGGPLVDEAYNFTKGRVSEKEKVAGFIGKMLDDDPDLRDEVGMILAEVLIDAYLRFRTEKRASDWDRRVEEIRDLLISDYVSKS
jgi:hypothetical protein